MILDKRTVVNKYQRIKVVIEQLSGSGFDCKWQIDNKKGYVRAYTEWHRMDQHGFYAGYIPFTLIIPKGKPIDFRLMGHDHSLRTLQTYFIDDYISDSVAQVLHDAGIAYGNYRRPYKVENGRVEVIYLTDHCPVCQEQTCLACEHQNTGGIK